MQYFITIEEPSAVWISSNLLDDKIDSNLMHAKFINYLDKNYIKLREKVNIILNGELIEELTDFTANGSFESLNKNVEYTDAKGFPFIRIKNISENGLVMDDLKFITDNTYEYLKKSKLEGNEVLFSKTGANLGLAMVFPENFGKASLADNTFKVIYKEGYDKHYLVSFFNSKYGKLWVERLSQGSAQPTIIKESFRQIKIPIPSPEIQKYIGDKVRKAEELREEAKRLKKEAEEMLENSINIDMSFLTKDGKKYTWVNRDGIDDGNITGDYYKEIYMEIEKRIDMSELKFINLGEVTKEILLGNTKKVSDYYCNGGVPYITTKNIKREGIDFSSLLYIPESKHNNDLKKSKAFPNDILYNKSGNVGLSSLLTDEYKEYNVVSDIIIIRPDIERINAYYLVLFLNSKLGKNMSERMAGGAIFQHISIYDIAKIKVPMLPFEIQTAIGKKKMKSELYSKESQKLIDEAKKDIEDLIEGNFDMSKVNETN